MDEIYSFDEDGRPVPKYYTPLDAGVFVEDQERGRYFREADGTMREAMRPTERRSLADRALGRDDPQAINERTWIDKTAGVPRTVGKTLVDMGADLARGADVAFKALFPGAKGDVPDVVTEDGEVLTTRPAESTFGAAAESLRDVSEQIPIDPNDRREFLAYQLPAGLTQMGAQVGTAAAAGPLAATALFSTQAAGRGYEDAKANGADEDTAVLAGVLNAPIGALEMLPIAGAFGRVNRATGGTLFKNLARVLQDGVEGGIEEAVQEAVSQSLSNKVAQELYDADREVFGNITPAMQQGGAVGFIASALLSGIARTRLGFKQAGRGQPSETVDPEVFPPPEDVNAEWISDETGVARREAGVSGPRRFYQMPDGPAPAPADGIDTEAVPSPALPAETAAPKQITGTRRRVTVESLLAGEDVDAPLTPAERALLPENSVTKLEDVEREWGRRIDEDYTRRRTAILNRAARKSFEKSDVPVLAVRRYILDHGGLRYDPSMSKSLWESIPANYRFHPKSAPQMFVDDPARFKQYQKGSGAKNGVVFDKALQELVTQGSAQAAGLDESTSADDILDLLHGNVAKMAASGDPRYLSSDTANQLADLEQGYVPQVTRKDWQEMPPSLMRKRLAETFRDHRELMEVPVADLAEGDVVRMEDELYEVQQNGDVKVLQDGMLLSLDEVDTVMVEAVVPKGHPVHEDARNWYNRIEDNAAEFEDMAAEQAALAEEMNQGEQALDEAPVNPDLAQEPEPLTLEAVTPEELEAEKDRLAQKEAARKAQDKLNTARKGTAGDLGQGALFDDVETDLWSGPSAEAKATAVVLPQSEQVANGLLEHQALIHAELRKVGVRPQDMEDVMQDVALRALEKAATFDPAKAQVQTWLGTLARNVAKNRFAAQTAKKRDSRATVSLQAPVGAEEDAALIDLIAASDKDRSLAAYREALAVTPLTGLEGDIRDGVLAGKGVEDIAAEQGLTPAKVRGILKVVGRKASRELPREVREADILYGLQRKQIPENELDRAVREQLEFFQRLDAVPSVPYQGSADRALPGDIQRRKAALAKAFADPLNPKSWEGLLKHGEPASFVIRELVTRPTDLAWPVAGVKIKSAKDAMALTMMLRSPYQESLKVMGLNDDNVVLGGVVHSVGSLNSSIVSVGNLLGQLPPGTTKVVLVHNHPSGNPNPSPDDLNISRQVVTALNAVGLELVDHVTTDDWQFYSQKESGLITFTKPVKSARVPGKVILPAERNLEDVTAEEPEIPVWSAVNRSTNRMKVHGPEDLRPIADTLRQGHPDAAFLVGLDSQHQVTGVTLFDSLESMRMDDYMTVRQAMAMQEEALRFVLLHPESGSAGALLVDANALVEIGRTLHKRMLDVTSATGHSVRDSGMVAFEPKPVYRSALNEVRELSAVYKTAREKVDQAARYLNARQRGAEYKGPGVESLDKDVEARLKEAKTLERKPWWKRENWRETARAFTRAFPEIGDADGRLIYELESVQHVAGAAEMISQSALLDITNGMGSGQMDLFERILAARDVRRSIREGLYENTPLPFGWKSPESVDADLAHWEGQLDDNPQVEESLRRRSRYMAELRAELVDHKLLPEEVLNEEDYFRRLTLEYMRESDRRDTGPKGLRDEKSGFQKRRKGGGDFVLDYLTAEHDVISHALAALQYKRIRDNIQALADKAPELKQEAKTRNRIAVHGGEANYLKVQQVLEQVANLRAEEKYTGEPGEPVNQGQEIALLLETIKDIDVLRPFRALKAKAVAMWESATGESMPPGNPNDVMTDALQGRHGQAAGYAAGRWFSAIQQEEKFIKDQLGREYIRWRGGKVDKRLIPEGYVPYAIKPGHRMFRAMSVSEAVLEDVLEGHRDLLPEDVKEVLVSAGAFPEWVIPENLARALNRMEHRGAQGGAVDRLITKSVGTWKGYKLTAPWHFPKYTFNNATGDGDFMLALEPRIAKYVRQAIAESYAVNIKRKMTPEMEELAMRGVLGGIMRAEIGGIRQAELFSALSGENPTLMQRYMQKAGGFSKFREDILRLAAYRYYQDALKRGERPHGASNHKQIESLYEAGDFKEAAMVLARQAMLDYNNPSQVTEYLRQRAIPFATFKMGNIQRYFRLMRNLAKENDVLSQETARAGAIMGATLARKAIVKTAFATIMASMVIALNRLRFPDEEESLRRNNREGQLIVGVGKDGIARTLRIEGSITAFLNAFGLEEAGRKVKEVAGGQATAGETMKEIAGDAASDWVSSAFPMGKTAIEAATRQSLWPDMFHPRPVRDRVEHVASYVSANHLWNRLSGKPQPEHRRGIKSMQNWLLHSTDLGEMDYWYTRSLIDEHLGKDRGSYISSSRRDTALYHYRKAVQYNDFQAQNKYLNQYLDEGGKLKNLTKNIDNRHPFNDLKTKDQQHDFLQQLKPSDRRAVENALKWYNRSQKLSAEDIKIMSEVVKTRQAKGFPVSFK